MNKVNLTVKELVLAALFAALMCIFGPMSVPIGPVPVSLTNLVIYIAAVIIGAKLCTVSYVVYLLLGLVGLPVFSGFSGGAAKLAGPTGGYLVGFIFMAIVCGLFAKKFSGKGFVNKLWMGLGFVLGTIIAYALGTVWFVVQMKCEVWHALTICVFPFIVFDIIKIVIAILLGTAVKSRLRKAE